MSDPPTQIAQPCFDQCKVTTLHRLANAAKSPPDGFASYQCTVCGYVIWIKPEHAVTLPTEVTKVNE